MIETDYDNACIILKRNGKVTHTFRFKEFVSASDFKPINEFRNRLSAIQRGDVVVSQEEASTLDVDFYTKITSVSLENPLSIDDALNILTAPEIGKLTEEILIFLVNWSTTEAVKKYASQLSEIKKKEEKLLADSQKSQNG